MAFALHPERRVWAAVSWGSGDRSSKAQSHVSGRSPGPPRRPCVHTRVLGSRRVGAGRNQAPQTREEHGASSEVGASPASLPAPATLPRAGPPERGCCPSPGGAGRASLQRGPRMPAAVRGRAADSPHAAGTAFRSCGMGFLSELSPAAPRAGPGACWLLEGGQRPRPVSLFVPWPCLRFHAITGSACLLREVVRG